MKQALSLLVILTSASLTLCGCGHHSTGDISGVLPSATTAPADEASDGHAHDEVSLGTVAVGDLQVRLAQGHGHLEAGKESHLVVKLPYSDKGSTTVRAWIGTQDRTLSYVGKGEYDGPHDAYDVHASAPNPLTGDAMWWVEIVKPDGTKAVGSAKPIVE